MLERLVFTVGMVRPTLHESPKALMGTTDVLLGYEMILVESHRGFKVCG